MSRSSAQRTQLFVCETCIRDRKLAAGAVTMGRALADRLEARVGARADVALRIVACLRGCLHPATVSLRAPDKVSLRLSRLRPEDADAIVELLETYARSADGKLSAGQWPNGLSRAEHLSAEIPVLSARSAGKLESK